MSNYDYLFKVILLCEEEEITNFFLRSINAVGERQKYIIGLEFGLTTVKVDDSTVKIQIWNPSIKGRFSFIRPLYYRGASGIIIATNQDHNPNNLSRYVQELVAHCGQVPVNFVIRCSPQFAKALKVQSLQLDKLGIDLPINTLSTPRDLYPYVGQSLLDRQLGGSWSVRLNLLIDPEYPGTYPHVYQKRVVERWLNYLEELIDFIQNWQYISLSHEYYGKRLDKSTLLRRLEEYFAIIESMGATINRNYLLATVSNRIGEFLINLSTGLVHFTPKECKTCEKRCFSYPKSVCIVQDSYGWTSFNLSKKQLLIITKIYALQNEQLPDHVWNQMLGHKAYAKNGCAIPFPSEKAATLSNTFQPMNFRALRESMLQELERLKRIMRG